MKSISVTYGLGGFLEDAPHSNVVESVSADVVDGVWVVSTWTPDGTTTRPATDAEVAAFDPPPAPPSGTALLVAAVRGAIAVEGTADDKLAAIDEALAPFAG